MTSTVAITETMEQVHALVTKYLALHREVPDEEILVRAIAERWGAVDVRDLLQRAELNSIGAARLKDVGNPKKNPWVDTRAQGDLFNDVPFRVPSILMIDGKPRPYYEVSIVDGMEWWSARTSSKNQEATAFIEAGNRRAEESDEAAREVEKLEAMVRRAIDKGVDPRTILYARAAT